MLENNIFIRDSQITSDFPIPTLTETKGEMINFVLKQHGRSIHYQDFYTNSQYNKPETN